MYRDVQQWLYIRSLVLEQGKSRKQLCARPASAGKTVRKMLANSLPPAWQPRRLQTPRPTKREERDESRRERALKRQADKAAAQDWMRRLTHGRLDRQALRHELQTVPDLDRLLARTRTGTPTQRRRALAVLGLWRGFPGRWVCAASACRRKPCAGNREMFEHGGAKALFAPQVRSTRKTRMKRRRRPCFPHPTRAAEHSWFQPHFMAHGRSLRRPRTTRHTGLPTGRARDHESCRLSLVQGTHGAHIKRPGVRGEVGSHPSHPRRPAAGRGILLYRRVWTFRSPDASGTQARAAGEAPMVPQWQQSRGSLILTAALELSSNQITHFYSEAKNTAEMIRMLDLLAVRYS